MSDEKRPVAVTWKELDADRKWVCHNGVGVFHRWGEEYEEFESGPGNTTVAIVELSDGTVKTITPEMVEFLDV